MRTGRAPTGVHPVVVEARAAPTCLGRGREARERRAVLLGADDLDECPSTSPVRVERELADSARDDDGAAVVLGAVDERAPAVVEHVDETDGAAVQEQGNHPPESLPQGVLLGGVEGAGDGRGCGLEVGRPAHVLAVDEELDEVDRVSGESAWAPCRRSLGPTVHSVVVGHRVGARVDGFVERRGRAAPDGSGDGLECHPWRELTLCEVNGEVPGAPPFAERRSVRPDLVQKARQGLTLMLVPRHAVHRGTARGGCRRDPRRSGRAVGAS